jgi:hypothetical protein
MKPVSRPPGAIHSGLPKKAVIGIISRPGQQRQPKFGNMGKK